MRALSLHFPTLVSMPQSLSHVISLMTLDGVSVADLQPLARQRASLPSPPEDTQPLSGGAVTQQDVTCDSRVHPLHLFLQWFSVTLSPLSGPQPLALRYPSPEPLGSYVHAWCVFVCDFTLDRQVLLLPRWCIIGCMQTLPC